MGGRRGNRNWVSVEDRKVIFRALFFPSDHRQMATECASYGSQWLWVTLKQKRVVPQCSCDEEKPQSTAGRQLLLVERSISPFGRWGSP